MITKFSDARDGIIWLVCGPDGLFGYVSPWDGPKANKKIPFVGADGLRSAVNTISTEGFSVVYSTRDGARVCDILGKNGGTRDPLVRDILFPEDGIEYLDRARGWYDIEDRSPLVLALFAVANGAILDIEDDALYASFRGTTVYDVPQFVEEARKSGFLTISPTQEV